MKHRVGVIAAVVGGTLLAGGIGYAAIPDSSGVIHTCYSQATGTWRPIDTEANPPQKCKSGETTLSWNQNGPQGPQGPQGPEGQQGVQGPPGPTPGREATGSGPSAVQGLSSTPATVVQIALSAGTWDVIATAGFNNPSAQDALVQCDLTGADNFGQNNLTLDNNSKGSFYDSGQLTLIGTARLSGDGQVTLDCSEQGADSVAVLPFPQIRAIQIS